MASRRKKKRLRQRQLIIIVLAVIGLTAAAWIIYKKTKYRKIRFTRYPEFGISIPENYAIHGIDVSRHQDLIAWEEVQAMKVKNVSLGFVFIKATEGIGNTDPQFNRNWKKAKANGMICGAYHFFIASKDGKMQAENFINRVDLDPGDLPPVLDVEQMNGTPAIQIRKEVKKWLETAEAYYNVKPIIYTNVAFYERVLGEEFNKYPLWVAHYYQPGQPRIKRGWMFWQHNDEGRVNGIVPKVDFNVFSGDSLEFRNMLVK